MTSRIGFFLFLGLLIGPFIANYYDYNAVIGVFIGAIVGAVLGFFADRLAPENKETEE